MEFRFIKEPVLEFGKDIHLCPKAGISQFDVYDTKFKVRKKELFIGAVGTSRNIVMLSEWMQRCSDYIPAKPDNNQPNLFTSFCGFNEDSGFKSSLIFEEELTKKLNNREINKILEIDNWNDRVNAAVDLYYEDIKFLSQNRIVDVIVCVIPNKLYDKISKQFVPSVEEKIEEEDEELEVETNFRRALKARAMHLGKPLQLIIEASLKSSKKLQDDATKAWNFCTALYYKAHQTVPWRLVKNINRPSICYVGIGFYRSRDRQTLNTSLAQIFDELGNGVILRGTPVDISKTDRKPHLTSDQACDLLDRALKEYEIAMDNMPGRLVIHKTSNYDDNELDGFRNAADDMQINTVDFVTILDTATRIFRDGIYPPSRGTHLVIDEKNHLLYTKGSVAYYETYPGPYIPQPIAVRIFESEESPETICEEILALTKMNWNNTQFDGKYPITIECARRVGQIMKYVDENENPQIRYSFYM